MSLFNYNSSNIMEVLIWEIDKHGFVQVVLVKLEV